MSSWISILWFLLPALIFVALACGDSPSPETKSTAIKTLIRPGDPSVPKREAFNLAVFLPDPPALDVLVTAEAIRARTYSHLLPLVSSGVQGASPGVQLVSPPIAEYAPPQAPQIEYLGRDLSPEHAAKLPLSKNVLLCVFHARPGHLFDVYPSAVRFIADVAAELGGIIWDEETRQAFSPDKWKQKRTDNLGNPPNIKDHTCIHQYRDGDLFRLVTLGMAKFDLPDVAVDRVSGPADRSMGNLVNVVCQTLFEQRGSAIQSALRIDIDAIKSEPARLSHKQNWLEGATGRATLDLELIAPEDGDAANLLLAIRFPGPESTESVRQMDLLHQIWGSTDQIKDIKHTDEIEAEVERERAALMLLKPLIQKGLQPKERVAVKGPFRTSSGGNEWMWVDVVRWDGLTIFGVLQNDPRSVPGLKAGAMVEVLESTVFDYIHLRPDGTVVGNTTKRFFE